MINFRFVSNLFSQVFQLNMGNLKYKIALNLGVVPIVGGGRGVKQFFHAISIQVSAQHIQQSPKNTGKRGTRFSMRRMLTSTVPLISMYCTRIKLQKGTPTLMNNFLECYSFHSFVLRANYCFPAFSHSFQFVFSGKG